MLAFVQILFIIPACPWLFIVRTDILFCFLLLCLCNVSNKGRKKELSLCAWVWDQILLNLLQEYLPSSKSFKVLKKENSIEILFSYKAASTNES